LQTAHERVKATGLITVRDILDMQSIIVENRAGFRKLPGTELKNQATGQTVYPPPRHPDDIALLMSNLEEFLNRNELADWDPLTKMALIHHQIESIHPFYDGNGRTGRVLNILYLVMEQYKTRLRAIPSPHYLHRKTICISIVQTSAGAYMRWRYFMRLRLFGCAALAAVVSLACIHPGTPTSQAQKARLCLSFGLSAVKASATKGFAPADAVIMKIHVKATGPGGVVTEADSAKDKTLALELAPGNWSIEGSCFSSAGAELARGSISLSLSSGEARSATLALLPLSGKGSVLLNWSIKGEPGSQARVEGRLCNSSGGSTPISALASLGQLRLEGLDCGSWTLELRLEKDGAALCGLADSVLVVAGLETMVTIAFDPPAASLGISLALPEYTPKALELLPPLRRVAQGTEASFRVASAQSGSSFAWYKDGTALAASGSDLRITLTSPYRSRLDCIESQASQGAALLGASSGQATILAEKGFSLANLSWVETIAKEDAATTSPAYARALGGLRDIAFSPDGLHSAIAGKEANAISVFACPGGAATYLESSLGGGVNSQIKSPERLAFLDSTCVAALSPTKGTLYMLNVGPGSSSFIGELNDTRLAGASDVAALPGGQALIVAATSANLVGLITLDDAKRPSSMQELASKSFPGCESLAEPSCLAINAQGDLVALGTTGDDALYLFTLASSGQALSLASRIAATDCSSFGSLSNPCDLAFSPEGTSLFVLANSSRTVFRFDKNAAGRFVAVAASKSGSGGASGFAYPKRLALSSEGRLLAVIGSGTGDGIALFDVSVSGTLGYLGSALSTAAPGDALPEKPLAAAFSPTGKSFALGAENRLVFYSY